MEKTDWSEAPCPFARSISLLGEWGALLIVREAFGGTTRFDDFQKKLGMSRNLLTSRLRTLVDGGVLERRPISPRSRRHEYVLSEMGEDLITTVVALRQWGDRWLFKPALHPAEMIDAVDGTTVQTLAVRSTKGRLMARKDLRLQSTNHPRPQATPETRTPLRLRRT